MPPTSTVRRAHSLSVFPPFYLCPSCFVPPGRRATPTENRDPLFAGRVQMPTPQALDLALPPRHVAPSPVWMLRRSAAAPRAIAGGIGVGTTTGEQQRDRHRNRCRWPARRRQSARGVPDESRFEKNFDPYRIASPGATLSQAASVTEREGPLAARGAAEPAHLAALAADVGHRTGERRVDARRFSLRFQVASEAVPEGLRRASR